MRAFVASLLIGFGVFGVMAASPGQAQASWFSEALNNTSLQINIGGNPYAPPLPVTTAFSPVPAIAPCPVPPPPAPVYLPTYRPAPTTAYRPLPTYRPVSPYRNPYSNSWSHNPNDRDGWNRR